MSIGSVKTLDAIRRLALKDLDATSDEELRAEIEAEGHDPEAVARSVAIELDVIMAAAMRERAVAAKNWEGSTNTRPKRRPAPSRIRCYVGRCLRNL